MIMKTLYNIKNGRGRAAGVPPGLQNLCWALTTSWVGSIPTLVRQREYTLFFKSFSEFCPFPF